MSIIDKRTNAESQLKRDLAVISESDDIELYVPPFTAFASTLFDSEAEAGLDRFQVKELYKAFLQEELAPRIVEGIMPDRGMKSVKANWIPEIAQLEIENEIGSEILLERQPDGMAAPAREEIQAAYAQHGDWENFAPGSVQFRLRFPNHNASVREALRQVLGRRAFYWLDRFTTSSADSGRSGAMETAPETFTPEERFQIDGRTSSLALDVKPAAPQFSAQHRVRFGKLAKLGELYAINLHVENLDFGPWSIQADHGDPETKYRLKRRFRAAARGAASAAGAPFRANLLDWWISKLARGQKRPFIQGLIERSAEYCEELESNALELKPLVGETNALPGLCRDRYPCERPVPYWLYSEPHRVLPDPNEEFAYWEKHIWDSFNGVIEELAAWPRRKRRWVGEDGIQHVESKEDWRCRVKEGVEKRTKLLEAWILGLSYDVAVLQANYILDRGFHGIAATQCFELEATAIIEKIRLASRTASKRLGLSWRKLERRGAELDKPFREVRADLAFFLGVRNHGHKIANRSVENDSHRLEPMDEKSHESAAAPLEIHVGGIPSQGGMYAPGLTQQMKFAENRHTLPDAPEEVKVDFQSLSHAAILAITRTSSVVLAQVDDWLERLIQYGYSCETMEQLVAASKDHLIDLYRHELAVGTLEQAGRLQALANQFDALLNRLSEVGASDPTPEPTPPEMHRAGGANKMNLKTDKLDTTVAEPSSEAGDTANILHENGSASLLKTKKRGRRPDDKRRTAIHDEIARYGGIWREHLSEIFGELDKKEAALGDFLGRQIDLGDGQYQDVSRWEDLDLAQGEERRQIVDALRKYAD